MVRYKIVPIIVRNVEGTLYECCKRYMRNMFRIKVKRCSDRRLYGHIVYLIIVNTIKENGVSNRRCTNKLYRRDLIVNVRCNRVSYAKHAILRLRTSMQNIHTCMCTYCTFLLYLCIVQSDIFVTRIIKLLTTFTDNVRSI